MTAADPLQQDDTTQPLTSLHPVDTIFVWDFDWTIVDCNSDEYVPAQFLGDEEVSIRITQEMKAHGPTKWHECVANLINACVVEKSCSKNDILVKASEMPYLIYVKQALTDVAKNNQCGQAIISDGIDKLIEAYLRKNEMIHFFTHGIETNVGTWENNAFFKVSYQSSKYGGHGCKRCPPNLCKSQVLKDILDRVSKTNGKDAKRPRIAYVGDGHNDSCPTLNVLNANDILLAREGKRNPHPNSLCGPQPDTDHNDGSATAGGGAFAILATLEKAKTKEGLVPTCRVCPWNTGSELHSLIQGILNEVESS
jgi:pyridoxal phosphate phosphatase PHOSPHO2